MNKAQTINLEKLINNSDDYVDNTEKIREIQHSSMIKYEVNNLVKLRNENSNLESNELIDLGSEKCNFLFTNYSSLFLKVIKDEVDMSLLDKFIDCLKEIEDGKKDQNEASVKVGTILKEIYIDSALRRANKLDDKTAIKTKPKNISWKQFKFSK